MHIDNRAEHIIQQAIQRGELDDLPGSGQPLNLDDDSMIPVELRAAYRILKNSGYVPEEVQLRGEISSAEQLLVEATSGEETERAMRKLLRLQIQLERARGQPCNLLERHRYCESIHAKLK